MSPSDEEKKLFELSVAVMKRLGGVQFKLVFHRWKEGVQDLWSLPMKISMTGVDAKGRNVLVYGEEDDLQALVNASSDFLDSLMPEYCYVEISGQVNDLSSSESFSIEKKLTKTLREEENASKIEAAKNKELQTERHKNQKRDETPYGDELAKALVKKLKAVGFFGYTHRDYCGTGFVFKDSQYHYVSIYDAREATFFKSFANEKEFVSWLALQSDYSLARVDESEEWFWDNQVITKERLIVFVSD